MVLDAMLCVAMIFNWGVGLTIFAVQPVYFQIALLEVFSLCLTSVFTTSSEGH